MKKPHPYDLTGAKLVNRHIWACLPVPQPQGSPSKYHCNLYAAVKGKKYVLLRPGKQISAIQITQI